MRVIRAPARPDIEKYTLSAKYVWRIKGRKFGFLIEKKKNPTHEYLVTKCTEYRDPLFKTISNAPPTIYD